jgi:hypothetical protein
MFSPGSKGWISKYMELFPMDDCVEKVTSNTRFREPISFISAQTGLAFGYPSDYLFCIEIDKSNWTIDEKLKVILFESLLLIYIKSTNKPDSEEFINECCAFYKDHKSFSLSNLLDFIIKDNELEKLEKIILKRVEVPVHLSRTKTWVSQFNNSFVFIDLLLFKAFICKENPLEYNLMVKTTLLSISSGAHADGEVQQVEKKFFNTYLASADLDPKEKTMVEEQFNNDAPLQTILNEAILSHIDFQQYLLLISALTVCLGDESTIVERKNLEKVFVLLKLDSVDLNKALLLAQQFLLSNHSDLNYFKDHGNVEKLLSHTAKRWVKVLGRNKTKLATELSESKELLALIRKSTNQSLSKEEKEKVKTQFLDLAKSMPALAVFLLPGGALILPLLLKIIPDLVPSAFRENELQNDSNEPSNEHKKHSD